MLHALLIGIQLLHALHVLLLLHVIITLLHDTATCNTNTNTTTSYNTTPYFNEYFTYSPIDAGTAHFAAVQPQTQNHLGPGPVVVVFRRLDQHGERRRVVRGQSCSGHGVLQRQHRDQDRRGVADGRGHGGGDDVFVCPQLDVGLFSDGV